MKIGIVGYGAMGKMIEEIASERGIIVSETFDINRPLERGAHYEFDVALDFSAPAAVCANIELLCEMKKNIVVGTTGWHGRIDEFRELSARSANGIVYGANFAVGMQVFMGIVREAARLIDGLDNFDVAISETHHRHKKDAPSGTAISLANAIISRMHAKTHFAAELPEGEIGRDALQISSMRCGEVFGTHNVTIDSPAETIELVHRAKNRRGFALGAVLAAEWVCGKSGFYDIGEIIGEILS